ncbi:NAD(P)-dependent glycerol-3-phosphate dehydrogenase [Parvibium lacunae]|uniref:Glycerol-3-phosphate dehydrogenase [NAD(P)+] n=1 Tax=Parvibium lacunae TaxID=1888893 RepID=A0A368L0V4_9BURK|nr:NAD(P)-dependent glycerol-3-phosphate dehydrogenase [Parvibium lacunae]
MSIAVLGAGAWGTALAQALAAHPNHLGTRQVILWGRDAALMHSLQTQRQNQRYLPGITLSADLRITATLPEAVNFAKDGVLILACSVAGLRPLCEQLATLRQSGMALPPLLWLCKGLEEGTDKWPHEIVQDILGAHPCGALSGPSFALEVAQGLPAALTLASADAALGAQLQAVLHGKPLRIYTSHDVLGVEVGGAVKNVLAIATGISDGLQLGLNARAALITRGLNEMARLAQALGGHAETMMGLAGLGDLLLTTTGDLSRNRKVGLLLASGLNLEAALAQLGHVAEGVRCVPSVLALANRHHIAMPLTSMVHAVLFEGVSPATAVNQLLAREAGSEHLSNPS